MVSGYNRGGRNVIIQGQGLLHVGKLLVIYNITPGNDEMSIGVMRCL
jgi:hypothetical protein